METVEDLKTKVTALVTTLALIGEKIDALKAAGGVASQQDLDDLGALVDQATSSADADEAK